MEIRVGLCATDFGLKPTLSRIVLHKVSKIICRNQIVQRDNCNVFPQKSLLNNRSKHETTNAAKAIYSNIFHSAYCVINSGRSAPPIFFDERSLERPTPRRDPPG